MAMAIWIIYVEVNQIFPEQSLGEKLYHSKPRGSNMPLDVAEDACAPATRTRRADRREGGNKFVVEGNGCSDLLQKEGIHDLRKTFSRGDGRKETILYLLRYLLLYSWLELIKSISFGQLLGSTRIHQIIRRCRLTFIRMRLTWIEGS